MKKQKSKSISPLKQKFLDYLDNHVSFITFQKTVDGTTYLDIDGDDGGDILDNTLMDYPEVKFNQPETVDEFIAGVADWCEAEIPRVSFSEFCKN